MEAGYGWRINEAYIDSRKHARFESDLVLDVGSYLNLIMGVGIAVISLPTLYMSSRIKIPALRVLFILFALFLIVHGLYHLTYFLGDYAESDSFTFLSGSILEPSGYVFMFGFVLYYAKRGG